MPENTVQFGISKCYVATLTKDESGTVTYGVPKALPGAVSIKGKAEGSNDKFYADNIVYYMSRKNSGYTYDLELANLPDWFRQTYMANKLSTDKLNVESDDPNFTPFALLFEFEGDIKAKRHICYNCYATRPDEEAKTIEDKKDPNTITIGIECVPLVVNDVALIKAHTTADTDSTKYANFFTAAPSLPSFDTTAG